MYKLVLLLAAVAGIKPVDNQEITVNQETLIEPPKHVETYVAEPDVMQWKLITPKEEPPKRIAVDLEKRTQQVEEAERIRVEKERVKAEKERALAEEKERLRLEKELQEKEAQIAAEQREEQQTEQQTPVDVYSSDTTLIAQLVHAEAKGEPYSGKVAVAEVILNRVKSGEFPNSVQGVVYQSGQFSPVTNGSINNSPTAEDYAAVKEALNGSSNAGGALYFYNPAIATSRWLDQFPTKNVIGNHYFK